MSTRDRDEIREAITNRLRRASGHLTKVTAMVVDDAPCVDVAQQLHAVHRAIAKAKEMYVLDHIENCLDEHTLEERSLAAIKHDLAKIARYL
jgi:hypothetical protein NreA